MSDTTITMYYDDACILCSTEAYKMHEHNPKAISLVPVDDALEQLNAAGFSRSDAMTYLCVEDNHGQWHTHMDAVRLLYKTAGMPWAKWLYLPVIKQAGDWVYPFMARNRYRFPAWLVKKIYGAEAVQACQDGICKINPKAR